MTRPVRRKHPLRHRWRWWLAAVLLVAIGVGVLGGCTTLGYYSHLAAGEAGVLLKRQPIREVVADPDTPAGLRQRLQLALKARAFASDTLKLPRNKSYTLYADIGRPFVMYNVFATPKLSLKPIEHCFLIAGCVAYQGFYHLDRAKSLATRLRKAGDDVYIGGVPAYSTLGHFADPILSSMNRWSTDELIGTIFHELAHQELYVKGDTAFNESFATFVEREGLRQWHTANDLPPPDPTRTRRQRQFTQLVLSTRRKLKAVYVGTLPDAEKLARKQAAFAELRRQYRHLRDTQWHGHGDYDHWMSTPLNNAKLLPFGLYDQYVSAFAALFRQCHGEWKLFYQRVRAISRQDAARRQAFLTGTSTVAH
ncbi:MAG TPA: aminopeptidase [Rhodanobacteraceae bacterium]|nr:aminopeptidase [Rhodanobacteraceae bacterium]